MARVITLRNKGLQTELFLNVLTRTTERQSASITAKLATVRAVPRIVSGRQEEGFA
jgi:hypothetical protein